MDERAGNELPVPATPLMPVPKFTTFRVTYPLRERLKALKKELGFRTYDALFNYTILEITREGAVPPASYDQVFEKLGSRPCLITGQSGAGKTTCVKGLLSQFGGNVFVLDVSDEYKEFKEVDLGGFFAIKWERPEQKVRFTPNPNVEISRGEAATIFSHLNFIKNSGALKNWCLVVEEGHRFGSDPNLRALLIEARKFVRKLILVTTDWRQFGDIAKAFKPQPWESAPEEGEVQNTESRSNIRLIQVGTDEEHGEILEGSFNEGGSLKPSSPYAASKAAASILVHAYHRTYGIDAIIARCTNNFGPYQFPEKLIPKTIIRAELGLRIPVYGSGRNVRDWIYVEDHCKAIDTVLFHGRAGEVYNISSGSELDNLEVVSSVLRIMGKPEGLIEYVEDKPGHDVRYSLDTCFLPSAHLGVSQSILP